MGASSPVLRSDPGRMAGFSETWADSRRTRVRPFVPVARRPSEDRHARAPHRAGAAAVVAAADPHVLVGHRVVYPSRRQRTYAPARRRPPAQPRVPGRRDPRPRGWLPPRRRRAPPAAPGRRRRGGRHRGRDCAPRRASRSTAWRTLRCARWRSSSRCSPTGCADACQPCTPTSCRCAGRPTKWSTATRWRCSRSRAVTTSRCASSTGHATASRPPRLVEPHQMVSTGHRRYLVAWDTRRDDWRTFRLDRMADVRLAGVRFAVPRDPRR